MKIFGDIKWNNISLKGKAAIIVTFMLLFLSYPYVFNRFFSAPPEQLLIILCFLIMIIIGIGIKNNNSLPSIINVFFLVQGLFWIMFFYYHSDSSYLVRIFFLIVTYSIIWALVKTNSLNEFICINNGILTIQSVLGAIAFWLVLTGVLGSFAEFTNTDNRTLYWYGISCTNTKIGNIIRPSGFFDEPGALACWGIYALIFNKLFCGSKKVEICLIIGLFFTLSVAYFIQIFFYFLFYSSKKKALITVVIIGIVGFFVYHYIENNEILRYLTIDRFEGGTIRSDRNELSEMAKGYFFRNPLMGMGAKNMDKAAYMADNQYEILAKDGLIGAVITYLPFFYLLIKFRGNFKILSALFILALGYLQRPFHINEMHYLMMYTFVVMLLFNYGKKRKIYEQSRKSDSCHRLLQLS